MAKAKTITGEAILVSKNLKKDIDLLQTALDYKSQIEVLDRQKKKIAALLEPIEAHFDKMLTPGGKYETTTGAVSKTIANSYSVKPEKYKQLKQLFGRKVSDFVVEKVSYGCQAALKKLLGDAEYEHGETVRDAVEIKQTTSIKFQAK